MNYSPPDTADTADTADDARGRASKAGRRPAAAGDTRTAILAAARTLFAASGFRGTTTRAIARRAGVDVALIHHFFGTKAELFAAAVQFPRIGDELVGTLLQGEGDPAERLARLYLDRLFVDDIETFSAVLRTAVGDPNDIPQLREVITSMLQRVGGQHSGHGASPLGLELIGAQMIGVLVMRYLVQVEPIASASTDELVRHLAPAFRALLQASAEAAPKEAV